MYFPKKSSLILIGAFVSISTWAQSSEAHAPVALAPESSAPALQTFDVASNADNTPPILTDLVITSHPAIRKKYAGHEQVLMKYRRSENLPEITNEAMLNETADAKQAARVAKGEEKLGTIPRLTILPCDDGCKGNGDYEKAVKAFLKNYENPVREGYMAYRGNMTIKVRWFNERGYFKRKAGALSGYDVFAYSFPLEGKLVTLSFRDSSSEADMDSLVTQASGMLNLMMMTQIGLGLKPIPLQELLPESEQKFFRQLNNSLRPLMGAIDGFLGNGDYRSRVEPMTDAFANLLPAVDGILPNEIDPLDKVVYFNHF